MQQLPLDIEIKASATFDNFIAGSKSNTQLLSMLQSVAQGQKDFIYIFGDKGLGKTHLLQAFTQSFSQSFSQALIAYLPLDNPQLVPEMIDGLAGFDAVCLDGIEHCLGDRHWETALFNLYNQLKEQDKVLLVSADVAPQHLDAVLPDLKSRLSAMLIQSVQPLSDDGKREFLRAKSEERGLEMSDDVINFVLSRQQRDVSHLLTLVDTLDQASLQAQRRLTIPFVKQVLAI